MIQGTDHDKGSHMNAVIPAGAETAEGSIPQYHIAAKVQEHRTHTLKQGGTFAIFDHRGDIGSEIGSTEGLYRYDTRILSEFTLYIENVRPLLLSSIIQDDNSLFSADLSNPDLLAGEAIAMRREQVHLHRSRFLWQGAWYERLLARNFGDRAMRVRLSVNFGADFADLFEVRGERRVARGHISSRRTSERRVEISYLGLDRIERVTMLDFDPAPHTLSTQRASFDFNLEQHQVRRIFVRVGVPFEGSAWNGRSFYRHMRLPRRHALHELRRRPGGSVDSSNTVFNDVDRGARCRTSICSSRTPRTGPTPTRAHPGSAPPSAATASSRRS